MPQASARARATAPLAAALAVALAGCSGDFNTLNLNPFSGGVERGADYNYFYRADSRGPGRVTSADLVGPDGRCAFEAAPAAPYPATSSYPAAAPAAPAAPQPEATAEPINPRSNQALYFTAGPQANPQQPGNLPSTGALPPEVRGGVVRGVSLEMTECQVVQVLGHTDRVEIGAEGSRRSVLLTYLSGERPGIYHFTDGRLVSMERVEVPEPAKKKRAPPKKTAKAKQGT